MFYCRMIKLINMKNARNEGTIKSVTRRRNMNVTKHSEPKCEISFDSALCSLLFLSILFWSFTSVSRIKDKIFLRS